ncbi:hypothetical protein JWS13_17660 [Rhodococcus pseudokoreensis]|uniref:ASCH domain-containing protein n=1 Tax=Rhodococcus pseudokoreensis TaxID=2811421 RepID=A0A974W3D8_9NOCA|nr:hypothetical protein [Rhodococcus pseudokoreensis]QSE90316.1 hypothetical protein JWS13_17660 [Rhodococcus pseudokoreensis]
MFPITVPYPTTILSYTALARDLADPDKKDTPLIVDVDTIDRDGRKVTRSALVNTISVRYDHAANPQHWIELAFEHPDLEDVKVDPDAEIRAYELTFEHIERAQV